MPARREDRSCSVKGCPSEFYAKGWCHRHYYRAARNGGDPLAFKVVQKYDRHDEDGNRWCTRCKTYLDPSEFSGESGGRQKTWCRECRRLARYGLTRETFKALPGADGLCPICQIREATHIDHDHACCSGRQTCGKCNRGVLCKPCNIGLGLLTDAGLERAMMYVGNKRV